MNDISILFFSLMTGGKEYVSKVCPHPRRVILNGTLCGSSDSYRSLYFFVYIKVCGDAVLVS